MSASNCHFLAAFQNQEIHKVLPKKLVFLTSLIYNNFKIELIKQK